MGKFEKYKKLAKGFYGRAKNCKRIMYQRVDKKLQHEYIGRKLKKRDMRKLWIQRINAGSREHGMGYGPFINTLQQPKMGIDLNRKVLAEMAVYEPFSFKAVVEVCKQYREANPPKLPKAQPKASAQEEIDLEKIEEMIAAARIS